MQHRPLLAALALLAPPALAGDLDPTWLPLDTAWVAHLDVQELVASKSFAHVREAAEAGMDLDEEPWMEELGVDPWTDLHSFTAYGNVQGEQDTVVVAETSVKVDAVLERMRADAPWRAVQHAGFTFDLFGEEGDQAYLWVHHPEGEGSHVLFAAGSPQRLALAVRTFQGEERSVVGRAEAPLDLEQRPGSFGFVAASMGLEGMQGLEGMAHMTRLVSGLHAAVGEDRHGLFLELAAQTASTEDAANLRRIVEGLRALVALAGDEVPVEVLELLDAIRIDLTGSRVSFSFSMPVERLIESLRSLEEGGF